jgi:hypothetical protein
MEEGPSEANNSSAVQEIPRILWNPKIHYPLQEPATGPYPEADESSPHLPTLFYNTYSNIILSSKRSLPFRFSN